MLWTLRAMSDAPHAGPGAGHWCTHHTNAYAMSTIRLSSMTSSRFLMSTVRTPSTYFAVTVFKFAVLGTRKERDWNTS